jgi:dipeptide/tripeptide permease
LNAAKQGAQAMLMIAGSLLVLAVGLKLMKEIDPGTMIKTGIAMSALGGGLFLLAKIPSADLKKAAESMLLVAASVSVLAIGMMLMKNVGVEGFIKTAVGLGAMVGVLHLLSKVDSSKLMKSATFLL